MIPFNEIPNNINTPFAYIEFDNSNANIVGGQTLKAVIIGQRDPRSQIRLHEKTRVNSPEHAAQLAGHGSMIHEQVEAFKKNDKTTELFVIALEDSNSGVSAVKTLTIAGTATETGIIKGYIGDRYYQFKVNAGDDVTTITNVIVSEINADPRAYFIASNVSDVVHLTAKHKGKAYEDITISLNHFSGDFFPAGITVAVSNLVAGDGNPDIQDALNTFGDDEFDIVITPYTDAVNLTALEQELKERFGPLDQKDGLAVTSATGTLGQLGTLGDSRNNQCETIFGIKNSPTPPFKVAASYGAVLAFYGAIDPARPFQTLVLKGVIAPKDSDRFLRQEREQLIRDGISTYIVTPANEVAIEYACTTYNLNAFGVQDISYQTVNSVMTLFYMRWSLRTTLLSKYPRHKLADDGIQTDDVNVLTPLTIEAELSSIYDEWVRIGIADNAEAFRKAITVERNSTNPNRIDFRIDPDLMNQARVFAGQIRFLL